MMSMKLKNFVQVINNELTEDEQYAEAAKQITDSMGLSIWDSGLNEVLVTMLKMENLFSN